MNQKKRLHLLIGLLLVCLVLLATGTYAAYTNTASLKRVVTTGIDSDAPPFSSNYLVDCSGNYYRYRISASEKEETKLYLTLFNYPRNNSTRPSSKDITYTLSFQMISDDGKSSVPDELPTISPSVEGEHTLSRGGVSFHTYTLTFTPNLVKKMEGCCLRVTATTTSGIPTSCTLGADFCLVPASGRSTKWSGKWIENNISASDALNFEISGTSEGTVKVDWSASADVIKLSQWCIADSSSHDATSATFDVGGLNAPTSILLQFYFVNGRPGSMPAAPNVTFTSKTSAASSSGADSPSQ